MFFNSAKFQTLESGLQYSWLKQDVHNQNIANLETPGYKAKNIAFSQVLEATQDGAAYRATITDSPNLSTRPDGNNVDMEIESLELYKAYVQHSMLVDKVKNEFSNYNIVLGSNMK